MPRRKKSANLGEESDEKLDMSRAGSLRRMADTLDASAILDLPTLADMLHKEADILDPPPEDEKEADSETAE